MNDTVTIAEKVALALGSSNLKHSDRPMPVDTVGALGLAGIDNGLASAVFRLKYSNEARFYSAALAVVTEESLRLSIKHSWSGPAIDFALMNRKCLNYWLNDRCMACEGRGFETILGTPHLSDKPCGQCNGSTKTPIPKMLDAAWDERFVLLLARIEHLERRAGGEVMAKLARAMTF